MKISIAVDGPAGAGKSTISKIIAERLNINYIDTGAMYRALTLKILRKGIDIKDKEGIIGLLKNTTIDFKDRHIFLDEEIVDEEIRTSDVSRNVSEVSKIKEVRERLVQLQREIASNKSVIMDGRDIGSHVLPDADYKFYLTASIEERGIRRYKEIKKKDKRVSLENIIREIELRDKIDSTREISPLIKCDDAFQIDTTNKSIDEVVDEIIKIIEKGGN